MQLRSWLSENAEHCSGRCCWCSMVLQLARLSMTMNDCMVSPVLSSLCVSVSSVKRLTLHRAPTPRMNAASHLRRVRKTYQLVRAVVHCIRWKMTRNHFRQFTQHFNISTLSLSSDCVWWAEVGCSTPLPRPVYMTSTAAFSLQKKTNKIFNQNQPEWHHYIIFLVCYNNVSVFFQ